MVRFFFYPNSIAIIGATANPKKFGNAVTKNVLSNKNLNSKIFLISKTTSEIMGLKCYKSILDINEKIDLVIILVPAKFVEEVIDECIQKRVKGIIIVTAGFGEINEKGKEEENKIVEKCKKAEIRVMGPNCVGIQNIDIGLNASFIQLAPKGRISMISQSGSFGCATFYAMERESIGCSKFANLGNMIDVTFNEVLEFYKTDENTDIISLYMESIAQGRKFLEIVKEIVKSKPVIILKGGRTATGMKAASSHTGSMATSYKMLKTAIKQSGAILCENSFDFLTALKTFSFLPVPKGENIGVLTNSGGSSVLFSDKAEEFGLKLCKFSNELKDKLKPYLIPLVKLVNPLDMIGVAAEEQYYNVTKIMLEDPNIDIVVPCCVIPPFLEMKSEEHYRGIINAWNDTGREKPIIPLMFFAENFEGLRKIVKKEKAPIFYTPHGAALATKLLIERKRFEEKFI